LFQSLSKEYSTHVTVKTTFFLLASRCAYVSIICDHVLVLVFLNM
jgi:hypothetical protein